MDLRKTIAELEKLFDKLNATKFNGQLARPIITIQTNGKRKGVMGWCTVYKAWEKPSKEFKTDDKTIKPTETNYEINVCAEFLNGSLYDIADTMLHEMVHLYNITHGVKDCSGKKHNRKFRDEAEARGLAVEKEDSVGFGVTSLLSATQKLVDGFGIDMSVFEWKRVPLVIPKKEALPKFKYACPSCGKKFTSSSEVNAQCKDCKVDFIKA